MIIIMKNDDLTKISIIVVPSCWVLGAIVALIMYFAASKEWMQSYILGLVTALLNLGLILSSGRGFISEVNRTDGAPVRRTIISYLIRIIIAGLVFAFIVHDEFYSKTPRFYVIPAVIGYITEKVVFIIGSLIINLNKKGKVNT